MIIAARRTNQPSYGTDPTAASLRQSLTYCPIVSTPAGEPAAAATGRALDVSWLYPSLAAAQAEPQVTRRTARVWLKALFGALRFLPS